MAGRYGLGTRRRAFRKGGFRKRRPYVAKLNRSIYDADCYIKVQKTLALTFDSTLSATTAQMCMRSDVTVSGPVDFTYLDQPEYIPYRLLYNLAELRGMKMEVTIGQYTSTGNKIIHGGRIYAGPSSGVPINAGINEIQAAGLPTQTQVNMQGQLSS